MTWIAVALGVLAAQYYWTSENNRLRGHVQRLGAALERTRPDVNRPYRIFGRLTESDVSQIETELRNYAEHGDSQASNPIVLMQWKLAGVGRYELYYEVEVLTEGKTISGNRGTRYVFGPHDDGWRCGRRGEWNDNQLDQRALQALKESENQ